MFVWGEFPIKLRVTSESFHTHRTRDDCAAAMAKYISLRSLSVSPSLARSLSTRIKADWSGVSFGWGSDDFKERRGDVRAGTEVDGWINRWMDAPPVRRLGREREGGKGVPVSAPGKNK